MAGNAVQYRDDDVSLAVWGTPCYRVGLPAGCEIVERGQTAAVEGAARVSASATSLPIQRLNMALLRSGYGFWGILTVLGSWSQGHGCISSGWHCPGSDNGID